MNFTALLIAAFGAIVVLAGFFIGNKVSNKAISIIIKIMSVAGGFFSLALFPVKDLAVSSDAGIYWFILLLVAAAVNKYIIKAR